MLVFVVPPTVLVACPVLLSSVNGLLAVNSPGLVVVESVELLRDGTVNESRFGNEPSVIVLAVESVVELNDKGLFSVVLVFDEVVELGTTPVPDVKLPSVVVPKDSVGAVVVVVVVLVVELAVEVGAVVVFVVVEVLVVKGLAPKLRLDVPKDKVGLMSLPEPKVPVLVVDAGCEVEVGAVVEDILS